MHHGLSKNNRAWGMQLAFLFFFKMFPFLMGTLDLHLVVFHEREGWERHRMGKN